MIVKIADNIISPLGATTQENVSAVLDGKSALKRLNFPNIPFEFIASKFENYNFEKEDCVYFSNDKCHRMSDEVWNSISIFEKIVIESICSALRSSEEEIDITSSKTCIIISSTKGNVEELSKTENLDGSERLGFSANRIASYFGNPNTPIVVSNACISGLAALILAKRLLENGKYDTIIVSGSDIRSKFIVSGFQSLKALSPNECRPYDEDRCGLNLGEAAATIILRNKKNEDINTKDWVALSGAIKNDAFHISAPSRKAEGAYRAIMSTMNGFDKNNLAFINAHGTATLFNDEMEAQAIHRAGLSDIPVNSLKGYYGHTMGAAGILETIISMHSIDLGIIPATRGFNAPGTGYAIKVSSEKGKTDKKAFLKLLSGFGGCNAAMLFVKGSQI